MPEFNLRSWSEQTLFDCRDYVLTADTLEEAVLLLTELQDRADDSAPIAHHAVASADSSRFDDCVTPLDPEEVIDGDTGVTLIDASGNRVRDLVGVPTGCTRLGEPIDTACGSRAEEDC